MTTDPVRRSVAGIARGWLGRAAVAVAIAGAVATGTAGVSMAQAHHASAGTSVRMVEQKVRGHFGKILVTTKGRALYVLPHGSCTAGSGCLAAWPRLVMPKGKTTPTGAKCLGTAAFGKNHRLQVSYRGQRLYTFTGDTGTRVTGNGVMGFKVAKVKTGSCPMGSGPGW